MTRRSISWTTLRSTMAWRRIHHRHHPPADAADGAAAAPGNGISAGIEPGGLAHVFAVPPWLRDLGFMSWLIVGTLVLLAGVVWLLALTAIIVIPVLTAAIIAAVLSPVVGWLARHGVGRGGGAAIDRKSTRLNSSHTVISYAVFCLKKKKKKIINCSDKLKTQQTNTKK